jgi:hypothetical protein
VPLCQVLGLELFPLRECVVVLAGVKADACRVAAPALTPAAGADLGRLRETAIGLVVVSATELFGLGEDLVRETDAGIEDLDTDEAAVFPVEGDEAVDTVGHDGSGRGAVRGRGCVAEPDVGGVRVLVVADRHASILRARSAASCQ